MIDQHIALWHVREGKNDGRNEEKRLRNRPVELPIIEDPRKYGVWDEVVTDEDRREIEAALGIADQLLCKTETPASMPQIQAGSQTQSDVGDYKFELGRWVSLRLDEARRFTRCLHSGSKPDDLRAKFPELFAEVIDKLNREINAALADPKFKERLADLGMMRHR